MLYSSWYNIVTMRYYVEHLYNNSSATSEILDLSQTLFQHLSFRRTNYKTKSVRDRIYLNHHHLNNSTFVGQNLKPVRYRIYHKHHLFNPISASSKRSDSALPFFDIVTTQVVIQPEWMLDIEVKNVPGRI